MRRSLVIIESPYAGDIERHLTYARMAMMDSIVRGEAPIASHLLYTQFLDDEQPEHRRLGIELGHAWAQCASLVAFYTDLGWSAGMTNALVMIKSKRLRVPYEIRRVNLNAADKLFDFGPEQPHVI